MKEHEHAFKTKNNTAVVEIPTEPEYTRGPLDVIGPSKPNGPERSIDYGLVDADSHLIAEAYGVVDEGVFRPSRANAFRLKACWNALAGIHDPEEFVKAAKELKSAVEAWRDAIMSHEGDIEARGLPAQMKIGSAIERSKKAIARAEAVFGGGK